MAAVLSAWERMHLGDKVHHSKFPCVGLVNACIYLLQVDSLVDVGAAAYAQLQKIKGQSLDDVDTKKNVCI